MAARVRSDGMTRVLITLSVMVATVMQALDTTIANVALPHMQGSMSAAQDQIAWVLTSYIVAAAIMTPATGFLAARFGRKRLFLWAVTGFTIASMLCGAATSLPELVAYRILQGAFGAGLVPLSQSVLLDTYPREKHGKAMAMWGVGVMVGPILGPTLGGYLTELHNWRWVFYINLPFGLLAIAGILAFVPETEKEARPFDWFGFTLLSVSIGAFQMMLDRGESLDWFASTEIVIEAVLAGLCLYMFVTHLLTSKRPFFDPQMFRDRNFAVGLVFIFVIGIILLATLALLPPFLQNVLEYPVLTTGYVLAPRGMGTMVAMMIVGRFIGRIDSRLIIGFGLGLVALSLWEMGAFSTDVSTWDVVRTGIVQGMGLGFVFVPLSTTSFATLEPRYRTEGTSMFSLMRNLGSSIGISIVISVLVRETQVNRAILTEYANPFNRMLQDPTIAKHWSLTDPSGLMALSNEITRQASMIAYLNDFRLMMFVTLATVPLLFLLRPPARRPAAAAGAVIE